MSQTASKGLITSMSSYGIGANGEIFFFLKTIKSSPHKRTPDRKQMALKRIFLQQQLNIERVIK